MDPTSRPVLVGVDGHLHSRAALEWAVSEARHRDRPLRILHALQTTGGGIYAIQILEHEEALARQILSEAVERVRELDPDLPVTTANPMGGAVRSLVEESGDADLVVVGGRGRGAAASAFLGSTSLRVAAHAHCAVAVVRHVPDAADAKPGIVVGTDGSSTSDGALAEAFRLADERGLHLTVVQASSLASVEARMAVIDSPELRERVIADEREHLEAAVMTWSQKYPDVAVESRLVEDHPVVALVGAAADATLLVVGSRGHGGFASLVLGSVGQGVLHAATCPVLVVRTGSA